MIENRIDPALKIPASTAGGLAIALLLLRFLPRLNSISLINPIRHYKLQLVKDQLIERIKPYNLNM